MKQSKGEKIFGYFNVAFLIVLTLSMVYPFLNILAKSFSGTQAIVKGDVFLWPVDFTMKGYTEVLKNRIVFISVGNSLFITAVGVAVQMGLTLITAYPLSRKDFRWRRPFFLVFLFTMLFNGGMIPRYLIVRGVGLTNSLWSLILPFAMSVYNMILMKNYMERLPDELSEAARIDGCNDLQLLGRIVIPLSKPMMATLALFYAVGQWNIFRPAIIYLTDQTKYPIQVIVKQFVLADMMGEADIQDMEALDSVGAYGVETLKMAVVVITTLPIILIYPFLQKYFAKGIMIGSVKG